MDWQEEIPFRSFLGFVIHEQKNGRLNLKGAHVLFGGDSSSKNSWIPSGRKNKNMAKVNLPLPKVPPSDSQGFKIPSLLKRNQMGFPHKP